MRWSKSMPPAFDRKRMLMDVRKQNAYVRTVWIVVHKPNGQFLLCRGWVIRGPQCPNKAKRAETRSAKWLARQTQFKCSVNPGQTGCCDACPMRRCRAGTPFGQGSGWWGESGSEAGWRLGAGRQTAGPPDAGRARFRGPLPRAETDPGHARGGGRRRMPRTPGGLEPPSRAAGPPTARPTTFGECYLRSPKEIACSTALPPFSSEIPRSTPSPTRCSRENGSTPRTASPSTLRPISSGSAAWRRSPTRAAMATASSSPPISTSIRPTCACSGTPACSARSPACRRRTAPTPDRSRRCTTRLSRHAGCRRASSTSWAASIPSSG